MEEFTPEELQFLAKAAHLNCIQCQEGSDSVYMVISNNPGYYHFNNDMQAPAYSMCGSNRIRQVIRRGTW